MMNRRQSSRNADRAHRRVLGKMHAAPKREAHPVITARELAQADGVLLGFPADAVRHDGGADEGVPRLHPRAGCGSRRPSPASSSPPARREAGRRPRHGLRARRVHVRRRRVRQPVRGGHVRRRRRNQDARRHRARHQGIYFAGVAKKLNNKAETAD
jgi:hypothetical protein